MFGKDKLFEKKQQKYNDEASGYIGNQQKMQGLLHKAIIMANERKGKLGDAWDKLQLFFELVKSYSKGEYKNVSTRTIITVVGALLYFVSPLDLVPDFIIGLGLLDDAAVIGYTVKKISKELDDFSAWKRTAIFTKENPLD